MRTALGVQLLVAASGLALFAGAASAQTTRNATVAPGKAARVAVVTGLKKDCSVGEVGSIRVMTAPKNGSIVVRGGKLKTPASFRCPNVETPVQALFYQPNKNYQGSDEISYETRSTDGETQTVTVKINVTSKPSGSGIQDL